MKKLICLMLLFTNAASAGVMNGGGGKSVVCRDQSGRIQAAWLLDVYEARYLYGLKTKTFAGTLEQIVDQFKVQLSSTLDQPEVHLFPYIDRVQKIMKFVGGDTILKPVDDAEEVFIPKKCKLEQLAHYVDDDLVLVSNEIWQALDKIDQAALILHEAVYRMERGDGAIDSRRARKFVGHVVSEFQLIPVRSGIPAQAINCHSTLINKPVSQFVLFPSEDGMMSKVQFFRFGGKSVYSKKTATLPIKFPWSDHVQHCSAGEGACAGADLISTFEGTGQIALGIEKKLKNGVVYSHFYFQTANGRERILCDSQL